MKKADPYSTKNPIIRWKELPFPTDWSQIFGRSCPLDVEVGFGDGRFLIQIAQKHPERNFVGIELSWEFAQKAARKLQNAGLINVRLLQLDAFVALGCLFQDRSISRIYSNFPDPWPKARHEKRRLFNEEFIKILSSKLTLGGEVYVATDNPDFRDFVLENFTHFDCFRTESQEGLPISYPLTKYAEKWLNLKRKIYFLKFELVGEPVEKFRCPIERSNEMPHVFLEGKTDLRNALTQFKPVEHKSDKIVVRLGAAFVRPDGNEAVIEAHAIDWRLTQRVFIRIKRKAKDTWLVKLDHIGHPLVTKAVKLTVRLTAEMLASLSELAISSDRTGLESSET